MKLLNSALCTLHSAFASWLPDMDLNHDKQIQSLLCYRYTIGQTSVCKVKFWATESSRAFKLQTPNLKLQRSSKSRAPNRAMERFLKFGVWVFSGAWSLELGALSHA
ncbi:MAG: hypothetical protein QOJ40_2199 [Verrucomicrobiota bacterium]